MPIEFKLPASHEVKFNIRIDHQYLLSGWRKWLERKTAFQISLVAERFVIVIECGIPGDSAKVADFLSRMNTDNQEINVNGVDNQQININGETENYGDMGIEINNVIVHSGKEEQNDFVSIGERIVNTHKTQIIIVERKQKESQMVNKKRRIFIDQSEIQKMR